MFPINVAEHVLSVFIFCFLVLSFIYAAVYFFIFIIHPHDPEKNAEQIALINRQKSPPDSSPPKNKGHQVGYSVYIQMAAGALVYSAIQSGRLNSNKVLMQLSWESDLDGSVSEVDPDECIAQSNRVKYLFIY
jgi:hypothetical protein